MGAISVSEAIARQEGFGKPNSRATRNHNPGNLNYGLFARGHSALGQDDKGYAIFRTNQDGWEALRALLRSPTYKGLTVQEAIEKYAPPKGDPRGENDSQAYIKNVCEWCGITPATRIDLHI